MKKYIAYAAGLTVAVVMALGVTMPASAASTAKTTEDKRDVGELLLLEQLFAGGNGSEVDASRLGQLFLLEELFGDTGVDVLSGDEGDDTDLGDLLVLDMLFRGDNANGNGILSNENGSNLVDLFVLDQLFSDENGLFDGTDDDGIDLKDLMLLDVISNGEGKGILGGNGSNFVDLFILDELFND